MLIAGIDEAGLDNAARFLPRRTGVPLPDFREQRRIKLIDTYSTNAIASHCRRYGFVPRDGWPACRRLLDACLAIKREMFIFP